ncbi:MAG: hypothetical protein ABI353_07385, partial [Isosphaeraceae bacterium]
MSHDAAFPDRAAACGPTFSSQRLANPASSGLSLDRRSSLAEQATRVGRREVIAEVVALRSKLGQGRIRQSDWMILHNRAKRRATRMRQQFYRLIDQLVEAGGFDDALAILR